MIFYISTNIQRTVNDLNKYAKVFICDIHKKDHYSVDKKAILKERYFIPKLTKQIKRAIANCVQCILYNKKRGKGGGLLTQIPKQNILLRTYHIDHIRSMPSTHKRYIHILTVVDAFTKFVWLYLVKSTSAKEDIDRLKFPHNTFGNPSRIISHKGPAFTSNDFQTYCQD